MVKGFKILLNAKICLIDLKHTERFKVFYRDGLEVCSQAAQKTKSIIRNSFGHKITTTTMIVIWFTPSFINITIKPDTFPFHHELSMLNVK